MSEKKEIKDIELTEVVKKLPNNFANGTTFIITQQNPNTYTHIFFKYPCKFIPEIPRWAINKYANKGKKIVMDPFSGSGTTLLEAKLHGLDAIGMEIDPIAKKIIKAKTENYTLEDIELIDYYFNKIEEVFKNNEKVVPKYPKINNLNHWYKAENLYDLGRLNSIIDGIKDSNPKIFLEVVLLAIVKKVSQADDASPKPYVSKKIIKNAPDVFTTFSKYFKRYRNALQEYMQYSFAGKVRVLEGDALNIQENVLVDLAITSPPYINAFDYPRTLRLENLWLNTQTEESLLESKSLYVGTERFNLKAEKEKSYSILQLSKQLDCNFKKIKEVDEKRAYVIKKFFDDMRLNLVNVNKHLKLNGVYVIVIGNSKIRNTEIRSAEIIKEIAENIGFKYEEHFSYQIKNPYIRIPRNGKGGIIKKDYVLVLKKVEEINDY